MRVVIVDCGAGNLASVQDAFSRTGHEADLATTPEAVLAADRLVLPGVGAAGTALECLRRSGLDQALDEAVRRRGRPMLGICLGLQLLADRLCEFGDHDGLGWIAGRCIWLRDRADANTRVPHMGWNEVTLRNPDHALFRGIRNYAPFYFCHSCIFEPENDAVIVANCKHGVEIVAAVQWECVFATQFHPEKSQLDGLRLIESFMDWSP